MSNCTIVLESVNEEYPYYESKSGQAVKILGLHKEPCRVTFEYWSSITDI